MIRVKKKHHGFSRWIISLFIVKDSTVLFHNNVTLCGLELGQLDLLKNTLIKSLMIPPRLSKFRSARFI